MRRIFKTLRLVPFVVKGAGWRKGLAMLCTSRCWRELWRLSLFALMVVARLASTLTLPLFQR
jgi:hypothetical protein